MNNELIVQGLMIAAIGMGLVFVVIIFLWGLMALLMRLTSGREAPDAQAFSAETPESDPGLTFEATERQRRAAAAAVAVGLAAAASRQEVPLAPRSAQKEALSPWQAFHRSRLINPEERRR